MCRPKAVPAKKRQGWGLKDARMVIVNVNPVYVFLCASGIRNLARGLRMLLDEGLVQRSDYFKSVSSLRIKCQDRFTCHLQGQGGMTPEAAIALLWARIPPEKLFPQNGTQERYVLNLEVLGVSPDSVDGKILHKLLDRFADEDPEVTWAGIIREFERRTPATPPVYDSDVPVYLDDDGENAPYMAGH